MDNKRCRSISTRHMIDLRLNLIKPLRYILVILCKMDIKTVFQIAFILLFIIVTILNIVSWTMMSPTVKTDVWFNINVVTAVILFIYGIYFIVRIYKYFYSFQQEYEEIKKWVEFQEFKDSNK